MAMKDDDKKNFIKRYAPFYFKGEKNAEEIKETLGRGKLNTTLKSTEEYIISKSKNNNGELTEEFVAWKAGRLILKNKENEEYSWDGRNGYGNIIENLGPYLDEINSSEYDDIRNALKNGHGFEDAYKRLIKSNNTKQVKHLGVVYVITLIYFLSGRKYPIYDKFAHIAVKALYMNENPLYIFVCGAPGKDNIKQAIGMYKEYCWLLKQVFGKYDIDRELDQALWVYGHSKNKYDGYHGVIQLDDVFL